MALRKFQRKYCYYNSGLGAWRGSGRPRLRCTDGVNKELENGFIVLVHLVEDSLGGQDLQRIQWCHRSSSSNVRDKQVACSSLINCL